MGSVIRSSLHTRLSVGAVLLAAGGATRLGGRPKALLELEGVPLVRRTLDALSGASVNEVVVVLGHHADTIKQVLRGFPVVLVHNPRPYDGQASSVLSGLRGLAGHHDGVIVALADQPLIRTEDILALISAFRLRGDMDMVLPRVDGLPGNPVMVTAALRNEWLAGEAEVAGRQWREAHPQRLSWFETDNRRYRVDIDTPEDLEHFREQTGHTLKWPQGLD